MVAPADGLPVLRVVLGDPDVARRSALVLGLRSAHVDVVDQADDLDGTVAAVDVAAPHVAVLAGALDDDPLTRLAQVAPGVRRLLVVDDADADADDLAERMPTGAVHGVLDGADAPAHVAAASIGVARCELVAPASVVTALATRCGVTGHDAGVTPVIDGAEALVRLAGGETAPAIAADLGVTAHLVGRAAAQALALG